mmetsp:Transcript_5789/g.12662  ORF Transcript_5789/g.12662 Transcript_5789/m.12662 type:complete len:690 (+) Transcript_5789:166-2235(+)
MSLSAFDEFNLDALLDESAPAIVVAASNADGATNDETDNNGSNDNALLLGEPDEQTFGNSNNNNSIKQAAPSPPATSTTYSQAQVEALCSNDNPDWAGGPVPCPNATYTGSDDIFEGVTSSPTFAPPPPAIDGNNNIAPNEFVSSTRSPSKAPSSTLSNDLASIIDGVGDTASPTKSPSVSPTTSTPTKRPSVSPSKQSAGTFITSEFGDSDETATTYPTFYSCSVTSQEELVQDGGSSAGSGSDAGGSNEEIPVRFDYEIYTATSVDDVTAVMSTFERQLTNGVASSLGLTDCPASKIATTTVEFAVRTTGGHGHQASYPWGDRKLLPYRGTRRTLQKERLPGGTSRLLDSNNIVGMSMDPLDELDTKLVNCTSSATLDTPSKCSPILGAMTVWVTKAQQRHLRQLVDTGTDSQEEMILTTVETYIKENEASYINDELLHVAYVGQRNLTTTGGSNPDLIVNGAQGTTQPDVGNTGKDFTPLIIGMATCGGIIVLLLLGAAWYRRRRSIQEAEDIDFMQEGAFPGLTPEAISNSSYAVVDDEETMVSAPPPTENERSDNLFRLNGMPSDAASVQSSGREITQPSSLAAMGGTSAIARQLSYSPQRSEGSSDGADMSLSPQPQDMAPDSAPILGNAPTILDAEDDDDISDTFEALDEDYADEDRDEPDVTNITALTSDDHDTLNNGLIV